MVPTLPGPFHNYHRSLRICLTYVLQIDTFSIWFVTMAFLGLLEKGTKDIGGDFTAGVINITSISGLVKLAQDHVCPSLQPRNRYKEANMGAVLLQQL